MSRLPATVVVPYFEGVSELEFADEVATAVSARVDHLVIDVGAARMLSSLVVETLHGAAERLQVHGGRVTVVCRHPALARLLRLILLGRTFGVVRSREEAYRRWP